MKLETAKYIWFDGQLVPWADAKIHVLSHVVHYGSGVFEGIRAYDVAGEPKVLGLDEHVERLFQSCHIISLPVPFEPPRVREAILETVRENGHRSCYIRPLVFRGYGELGVDPTPAPVQMIVATFPWGALMGQEALETGVDVGISSWRRMAPDTHPAMAKAVGNYLNSQMVVMEAKRHGYAEGIVLDIDGYVSEGSGENIFLVRNGTLFTPPVGASILAGITRSYVMQLAEDRGYEVVQRRVPREFLYLADEVFFSGTAAEITPIRSIDGKVVGGGGRGPITTELQSDFYGLLTGKAEDRHGWLTPVHGG